MIHTFLISSLFVKWFCLISNCKNCQVKTCWLLLNLFLEVGILYVNIKKLKRAFQHHLFVDDVALILKVTYLLKSKSLFIFDLQIPFQFASNISHKKKSHKFQDWVRMENVRGVWNLAVGDSNGTAKLKCRRKDLNRLPRKYQQFNGLPTTVSMRFN